MGKTLKIIILGGTGIIGRELSRVLIERGDTVYVVSRGSRQVVDGAVSIVSDAYDYEELRRQVEELTFDVVVDLVSFNVVQLEAMLGVFEEKCTQYMFVSSATVYASAGSQKITEESPRVSSGWSYPLEKIACEKRLGEIAATSGQTYTIVRPYITYSEQRMPFGIWEMDDVWRRIQTASPVAIGDEVAKARTTLTHAGDLAEGMAALAGNPGAYDEDFHITSDEVMTWREVYATAAQTAGKELVEIDGSVAHVEQFFPELHGKIGDRMMNRVFDNSKLYRVCPDLRMSGDVESGYGVVMGVGMDSRQTPGIGLRQARIDRLLKSCAKNASEKHKLAKCRRDYVRAVAFKTAGVYLVVYYAPWVWGLLRIVRKAFSRGVSSHYGL